MVFKGRNVKISLTIFVRDLNNKFHPIYMSRHVKKHNQVSRSTKVL